MTLRPRARPNHPPRAPAARAQPLEPRVLLATTPGPQENVSNTADMSEWPAAAVNGTKLDVIWGERFSNAVRFTEKPVGSAGPWPAADVFAEGTGAKFQAPDVAVAADGSTHIVYALDLANNTADPIYHRSRAPGAAAWSARHEIARDNYPNPVRLAAAPDGTLWTVWRDADGTAVRYRRSTDGGLTWNVGPVGNGNVATQGGNMFLPDLAVTPDGVPHVAWNRRNGGLNNNTIYWADYTAAGDTGWTTGTVGNLGGYTADAALAADRHGFQHLALRTQVGETSSWIIK